MSVSLHNTLSYYSSNFYFDCPFEAIDKIVRDVKTK